MSRTTQVESLGSEVITTGTSTNSNLDHCLSSPGASGVDSVETLLVQDVVHIEDTSKLLTGTENVKLKPSKDKGNCHHSKQQAVEEVKSKQKSKRSLIPFYSTFGFGNKGSKSPDKDKKRKEKLDVKSTLTDENDEGYEKKDREKEEEIEDEKEKEFIREPVMEPDLYIDNKLYGDINNEDEMDDEIPREFVLKKEIKSPKLASKSNSDIKKYSLVKARIAKYQKNTQKDRCNSPDADLPGNNFIACRSKTLDNQSKVNINKSKYSTLDVVRSKFQNQVNNLSYEGIDFPGCDKDIEYDRQAIYDELKLIYDGEDIYAIRERKSEPIYSTEEETLVHRPHLSIDSITLISSKNMKASLNISVSESTERISSALPDTRWRDAGKFSRRSLRRSSYRKKKGSKKIRKSSGYSSHTASPTNESDVDSKLIYSTGSLQHEFINHSGTLDHGVVGSYFPEYAKVNKKKNSSEALMCIDSPSVDYRKLAFKGCTDKGPVAKKIGQSAFRNRRELENNKYGGPVKKTESFKATKVGRKGSFTCNSRPKIIKRPAMAQHEQSQESENCDKPPTVKLRRRDSKNARKGEYRLSVTIQPSTVANLTDKFNSLISQNQVINEADRDETEIPIEQVIKEGKLGRIYHSPRASFKRKYRTRTHKNKRSSRKQRAESVDTSVADPVENESNSLASTSDVAQLPSTSRTVTAPKVRISNIKKVPSIGRGPGGNKTDEEKVCDKIETALSSGTFKGETDDSDAEQDEGKAKHVEQPNEVTEESIENEADNNLADTVEISINVIETLPDSDTLVVGDVADMQLSNQSLQVSAENVDSTTTDAGIPLQNISEEIELSQCDIKVSSSAESLTALPNCSHQKSESIDSGILSDENCVVNLVIHKIPETVQEDLTYGIIGAIDHCSVGNNNVVITSETKTSNVELKSDTKEIKSIPSYTSPEESEPISVDEELQKKTETSSPILEDNDETVSYEIIDKGESEASAKCDKGDNDSLGEIKNSETEDTEKLVDSNKSSVADDCVSDCEHKIYSSIIKAVVKNTVRKTKEKDALKKESEKEAKLVEKDGWFRRSKSRERESLKADEKSFSNELINSNDEIKLETTKSEEQDREENTDKNDNNFKETGTKPKKGKDGKIYESWIFKKIREKSQERKRFKELTPVEVSIVETDVGKNIDIESAENIALHSSENPVVATTATEDTTPSTPREKDQKEDGYGLFSFKSRGRNKEKKKTKTTQEKCLGSQTLTKTTSFTSKENSREESINSSPASSVRTQHSRKLSDASVCTIESESVSSKTSNTKLKASNSQRSTTSIPPPPKTPIPSPPKSARIILNIDDSEWQSDVKYKEENGAKGSTENIYENLYSPNIDKLKKNRAKLEERGIVPNNSFLWNDGNPPNIPVDTQASPIRTSTPERGILFSKITGIKSFGRPDKGNRDTSLPRMDHLSDDGHNYSELNQISSDDSHTTVGYDEIGGIKAVSYDDIRMSSSCSYDDIRAPSSVGYDSLKAPSSAGGYDPVNPPPARSDSSQYDECDGAVVTAQLAVVREDQLDSISYLYDDITYNLSQSSHSYEPVNPPGVPAGGATLPPLPLAITSIKEVPEPENSPNLVALDGDYQVGEDEDEGDGGAHEVFSYKLTRVGGAYTFCTAATATAATTPTDTTSVGVAASAFATPTASIPSSPTTPLAPPSTNTLVAAALTATIADSASTNEQSNVEQSTPENAPATTEDATSVKESFVVTETDRISTVGLRDSLRSSTSSYHSAYSSKYFCKSKIDSIKAREDEKTAIIAGAAGLQQDQKSNKKQAKKGDEVKESKFGFMGRKFRELGNIGKKKTPEKETSKTNDKTTANHKLYETTLKGKILENIPGKSVDCETNETTDIKETHHKIQESILPEEHMDEIYGNSCMITNSVKSPNASTNQEMSKGSTEIGNTTKETKISSCKTKQTTSRAKESTVSATCGMEPTTTTKLKKVKKPMLKLSDCPPLDEDCDSHLDSYEVLQMEANTIKTTTGLPKTLASHETYKEVTRESAYKTREPEKTETMSAGTAQRASTSTLESSESAETESEKATSTHQQLQYLLDNGVPLTLLNIEQLQKLLLEAELLNGHKRKRRKFSDKGGQLDEWEDIGLVTDDEEKQQQAVKSQRPMVRYPIRTRRCAAQPRVYRKTWSQGVRSMHNNYNNNFNNTQYILPRKRNNNNNNPGINSYRNTTTRRGNSNGIVTPSYHSNQIYCSTIIDGEDASDKMQQKSKKRDNTYAGDNNDDCRYYDDDKNDRKLNRRREQQPPNNNRDTSFYNDGAFTSKNVHHQRSNRNNIPNDNDLGDTSFHNEDKFPSKNIHQQRGPNINSIPNSNDRRYYSDNYSSYSDNPYSSEGGRDDQRYNSDGFCGRVVMRGRVKHRKHRYRTNSNPAMVEDLSPTEDYEDEATGAADSSGGVGGGCKSKRRHGAFEGRFRRRLHPDSDLDGDASTHYEAIYEAINELTQHSQHDDVYGVHTEQDQRDVFDDSFESDGSDYAIPQAQQLSEHHEHLSQEGEDVYGSTSVGGATYQRQGSVGSTASGSQSITKIAEAANFGIKKLRRNWSQTKTEVKTGISKIKKKGTFAASDLKSTDNIYSDSSPTSDDKSKWSFKKHFVRRKSTSSLVSPTLSLNSGPSDKEKQRATFYVTFTIETDKRDAALAAAEASNRLKGIDLKGVDFVKQMALLKGGALGKGGKDFKSVIDLARISDVGILTRPKSYTAADLPGKGRSQSAQRRGSHARPVRPKNAPPAPPSDYSESEDGRSPDSVDMSKKKLAMRLNELLSAGPTTRRGRRIVQSSHCSSGDSSPVPVLLPPDHPSTIINYGVGSNNADLRQRKLSSPCLSYNMFPNLRNTTPPTSPGCRSTLQHSSSSSRSTLKQKSMSCDQLNLDEENNASPLAEEIPLCIPRNVPKTRCSVVSESSSDGYVRPSDIASIPPPLPARPSSQHRRKKYGGDDNSAPSSTPVTPIQTTIPEDLPDVDNRPYVDFNCGSGPVGDEEPTYVSSHFADEPLYQFYTASVLERATYRQGECSSEDDYEVINDGSGNHTQQNLVVAVVAAPRPTAMELVTPADGVRSLWCELPEVLSSGILATLNSCERKVQEAMFEVITSEASYLKSLEVLVGHFFHCSSFATNAVISKREKNILFSDILPVKRCSETFLADLEKRWQESALISTISDIVLKHANSTFGVYVKYCSNQIYQDRILRELKDSNHRFLDVLTELESSSKCQSLAMHSFLMLPMQRITRLPLLLDAVFHRLEHGSPHWHQCNLALATLNKIVTECNEGARKMERMEEMLIISRQLDFKEVRAVPLISASRWLVKKGELTRLIWRDGDAKLTFGKRISKHTLYFFLFTDLLVITKRKSEDSYTVLDHCPRNMVEVLDLSSDDANGGTAMLDPCSRNMAQLLELGSNDKPPGRWLDGHKNLLLVTMLQNHENKTVNMVLSCALESERTRWVEAVTPRKSENPDEQIYEEWDCPQVQATHAYSGSQPDELSLEVSDVVNVLKKMADGWYQGERLRDGELGWFPGSYTREVASAHKRARNLRQRHMLLAISGSAVDELRRSNAAAAAAADAAGGGCDDAGKSDKEDKKDRRKTVTINDLINSQGIK